MNLLSAAERLATLDRFSIKLNPARCLHSLNKYSTCTACIELCPVQAIQPGSPPTIIEEKCVNCLACIPACSLGAFQADDAVPELLQCLARLENRSIELACEKHSNIILGLPGSEVAIQVRGCLAGLGAGALLGLASLGLEQVIVRVDACPSCPWGALLSRIQALIATAQRLLEPCGKASIITCFGLEDQLAKVERPVWNAADPPLSRRDLFRLAAHQGQLAIARTIIKDLDNTERRPGREHLRVQNALTYLVVEPSAESCSLAGIGFAWLSVSTDCTACGVCARVCPTGALQFTKAGSHYEMTFLPPHCIGCEACLHVCAPGALSVDHSPTYAQIFGHLEPLVLSDGELTSCNHCDRSFAAKLGEQLCPVCEYRRQNPFGSTMPPGFRFKRDEGEG